MKNNSKRMASAGVPASAGFLFAAWSLAAFGQQAVGLLGGTTRDSASGKPVVEALIIAHGLDQGTDRITVSAANGIFTFTNLEPGPYEVTAKKDGFQKSSAHVEVVARRTARVDLSLQGTRLEKSDNQALMEMVKQLLNRIDRLEGRLATIESVATEGKDANATRADAGTILRTRPLVASLSPFAALPPAAPLPQTPPAAGPTQAPASPQPAAPASPAPSVPEALRTPDDTPGVDTFTPFAFGDFTWLNGNARNRDTVLDTKFFTPEVRFDTNYIEDFNQPVDHTVVGSTESHRSGEIQVKQISVGGDFHWQNVRGRILTMWGLFATTTPRNDASDGVGQWALQDAYKYVSEAYGGYHFDVELLRTDFGVSLLLHEGGPTLFGRFVADGCVDELFLTIAPQVAGRNQQPLRPGFVAGVEFLPETAPWLDILSVKQRGNHLYLRYGARY